jgi:hypothetical protein
VANALKLKAADTVASGVQKVTETAAGTARSISNVAAAETGPAPKGKAKVAADSGAAGVADPMQWWGALTQQFQQIAATAMKDAANQTAIDATKHVAKQAVKAAVKKATTPAKKAAPRKRSS